MSASEIIKTVIDHFTPHSPIEVIGTVCGIICIFLAIINYIFTDRNKIIIVKGLSDITNGLNNLCYGKIAPTILNFIGLGRETVFFFRGKKKWADSVVWMYVFMAAMVGTPVVINIIEGWNWMELLPAGASFFSVYGLYSKNTVTTKICIIAAQIMHTIYQGWVGNITAFITSVMPIISAIIGLIREYNKYRSAKLL